MSATPTAIHVRVGLPLRGGRLVAAARERCQPVLFSANAFALTYPLSHARAGEFRKFALPDVEQLRGLDAALDSAGFVAAVHYGDYRWSVDAYVDLAAAFPWTWWASMDYCCEPEIAEDRPLRLLRIAATVGKYAQCAQAAVRRKIALPVPTLQGWHAEEYIRCVEWMPLVEWPRLVGVGSMCRRHLHGPDGIFEIVDALDRVLPSHVRLHLFGVKSAALSALAHHPRIHAIDSMARDLRARSSMRRGRSMEYRIECMDRWVSAQRLHSTTNAIGAGVQRSLLDPEVNATLDTCEATLVNTVALWWADVLRGNEWEYRSAVNQCRIDAMNALSILRSCRGGAELVELLNELCSGLGDRYTTVTC